MLGQTLVGVVAVGEYYVELAFYVVVLHLCFRGLAATWGLFWQTISEQSSRLRATIVLVAVVLGSVVLGEAAGWERMRPVCWPLALGAAIRIRLQGHSLLGIHGPEGRGRFVQELWTIAFAIPLTGNATAIALAVGAPDLSPSIKVGVVLTAMLVAYVALAIGPLRAAFLGVPTAGVLGRRRSWRRLVLTTVTTFSSVLLATSAACVLTGPRALDRNIALSAPGWRLVAPPMGCAKVAWPSGSRPKGISDRVVVLSSAPPRTMVHIPHVGVEPLPAQAIVTPLSPDRCAA